MTSLPEPAWPPRSLGPRGRRRLDRTLVLLLLGPLVVIAATGGAAVWAVLGVLQIAPLWWRRSHPAACFAAVAAGSALQVLVIDSPVWSQLAWPVALYSVARFASARAGWVALAVSAVATVVASLDWTLGFGRGLVAAVIVPYVITIGAIAVSAWTLGTLGRVRAAYVDALLERNERIQREAAQQVALAATAERSRIARELHDVVAHSLSVIIVQADGARYAAATDPSDPGVATATLGAIARTGREALTDMRRTLGLLREGDTGTAPVPDLSELRRLVAADGATHRLEGLERPVSGAVALTTYRVVQEALTNVRKHAGPDARASVSVVVGETSVDVVVHDHGRGAAAVPDGSGHGLLGMRERVAALGGRVAAGPAPGGGFTVSARIPL